MSAWQLVAALSVHLRSRISAHMSIVCYVMWRIQVSGCCCSAPQVANQVTTNQGSAAAVVGAATAVTPLPTQGTAAHPPQLSDTPGRPWSSLDFAGENQGGTPSGVVLDKLARGSPWSTAIKGAEFKSPKAPSGITVQLFVTCMHGHAAKLAQLDHRFAPLVRPAVLCLSADNISDLALACTDSSNRLRGFLQAATDIADLAQLDDLGGSLPTYDLQELPPSWKAVLSDPEVCVTRSQPLP